MTAWKVTFISLNTLLSLLLTLSPPPLPLYAGKGGNTLPDQTHLPNLTT